MGIIFKYKVRYVQAQYIILFATKKQNTFLFLKIKNKNKNKKNKKSLKYIMYTCSIAMKNSANESSSHFTHKVTFKSAKKTLQCCALPIELKGQLHMCKSKIMTPIKKC